MFEWVALSKLDRFLNADERVVWSGRPEKKAFVLPGLGSVLLVWCLLVLPFLGCGAPLLVGHSLFSRCSGSLLC